MINDRINIVLNPLYLMFDASCTLDYSSGAVRTLIPMNKPTSNDLL